MKMFLKYDYYIQTITFAILLIVITISLIMGKSIMILLFYFGVGTFQLISFLYRLTLNYPKSYLFKAYGVAIIPNWLSLTVFFDFTDSKIFTNILLTVAVIGFLLAPIFSIFYLIDCYKTFKHYEKYNI